MILRNQPAAKPANSATVRPGAKNKTAKAGALGQLSGLPTARTTGPRLTAEPFPESPPPPTTKASRRGGPHEPQFGAVELNISADGSRHCLQGRFGRRLDGAKIFNHRGLWPSLRPPATANSAPARGDGQLGHAGRRRRSPRSMAAWPMATSRGNQGSNDLTTCFSSEDGWRGPCASTDRDRRLRLLQALVMLPHAAPGLMFTYRAPSTNPMFAPLQ